MEQTHCPTSENMPLGRLVADALGEITRLGYSRRSRNRYRAIWEHLIAFSRGKELGDEFSADLAARFLEEYRVRDEQMDEPGEGWRRHVVFGVKVLADFASMGALSERSRRCRPSIFFPPCRTHFVITNSIARIDSTFDRPPFISVGQDSRSFWIFSIQEKGGPWTKFRHWICPNLSLVGIT